MISGVLYGIGLYLISVALEIHGFWRNMAFFAGVTMFVVVIGDMVKQ